MSNPLPLRPSAGRVLTMRLDLVLVFTTLAVAVLGVVFVYSATRSKLLLAGVSPHYYLDRQAAYVMVGVIVMAALALADYHWLEFLSRVLYVGIILALLAMFTPIGSRALGATRWFQLGPVQIQPSAFAALVMIVVVAAFCARRPDGLEPLDLLKVLALAGVPILLVVKQPDLGTGIVMSIVLLVMLVVAGIPNRYLVLLLAAAVLGIFAIVHLGLLKPYQVERLTGFLHQNTQAQGSSYNLHQSVAAIGSGGFWGAGLFHGPQTNLSYVPEQQTDFIFSAVGEQLGFAGAATVLVLLGVLSWRILHAAQVARDPFGRLLATGAFTLIAFSVFENAGMTMGIMPIAGIPLPFLSYGGSATVAFFAAVGLALSVQLRHQR
ncbi:MAG TPA: rod shape-determining protein RodA [Acidimicrobiales bacterium]|nr:rod shape-determining protein RodA [Acidimicrobiales bacterium]